MKSYRYTYIILLSLIFIVCEKGNAQAPDWAWAKQIDGNFDQKGHSIVVDGFGNTYSIGEFAGIIDFDPGVDTFNLSSIYGSNYYILKLDKWGNFLWAKTVNGSGHTFAISINFDSLGNIYIAGEFSDTVDFDPGLGVFNLTSNTASYADIFILKLDSSGNFIWVKSMEGLGMVEPTSIVLDSSANLFITGRFVQTVDFDPDSIGNYFLTSNGNVDIFICKLDSAGHFVWAKSIGSPNSEYVSSIALDADANIYLAGFFEMTLDMDPDTSVIFNLYPVGNSDYFLSKMDSSGIFIWAKSFGGINSVARGILTLDPIGNIYNTGYFEGSVDFNPDSNTNNFLSSPGSWSNFVSKLDNSGNFLFVKGFITTGGAEIPSITNDALGNVYISGLFWDTVDFDPGNGNFNLTSSGNGDIYISKLDPLGNFIWAKEIGGLSDDYVGKIALDVSGNLYLTGYFESPKISFDSILLINPDNINNTAVIFIAKLDTAMTTGVQSINDHPQTISLFPNPTNDLLTISYPSLNKKASIIITDITGKIIYQTITSASQKTEVNTKDFSAGVYLLQIQSNDFVETRKVIVGR